MNAAHSNTLPLRTLALFVLWLLLSESYTLGHMAIGFAAALSVAFWNSSYLSRSEYQVRWVQAFAYLPWLFGRILASGAHLSYLILHPKLPIDPKMIHHRPRLSSETALVILGNSITLTPGTITLEASSDELVVHAMDDESTMDVVNLRLENKISGLFVRRASRQ
ncbi:MAG: Na+/H+ antiporter subunit E [Acidobacteria bacterium]|nr:Na+/H+ antiporter subunit E [Acidobacteriota bacterium]MDA1234021.1 Na+/H+ antiporter subunit E [Acidobacteriota bacterium]